MNLSLTKCLATFIRCSLVSSPFPWTMFCGKNQPTTFIVVFSTGMIQYTIAVTIHILVSFITCFASGGSFTGFTMFPFTLQSFTLFTFTLISFYEYQIQSPDNCHKTIPKRFPEIPEEIPRETERETERQRDSCKGTASYSMEPLFP